MTDKSMGRAAMDQRERMPSAAAPELVDCIQDPDAFASLWKQAETSL